MHRSFPLDEDTAHDLLIAYQAEVVGERKDGRPTGRFKVRSVVLDPWNRVVRRLGDRYLVEGRRVLGLDGFPIRVYNTADEALRYACMNASTPDDVAEEWPASSE